MPGEQAVHPTPAEVRDAYTAHRAQAMRAFWSRSHYEVMVRRPLPRIWEAPTNLDALPPINRVTFTHQTRDTPCADGRRPWRVEVYCDGPANGMIVDEGIG